MNKDFCEKCGEILSDGICIECLLKANTLIVEFKIRVTQNKKSNRPTHRPQNRCEECGYDIDSCACKDHE